MSRDIHLYNEPPILVIQGAHHEIDRTIFDIGLQGGAHRRFMNRYFFERCETHIENAPSRYGRLDVYIRNLEQDTEEGDIAMVVTPGINNTEGIISLQRILSDLSPSKYATQAAEPSSLFPLPQQIQ